MYYRRRNFEKEVEFWKAKYDRNEGFTLTELKKILKDKDLKHRINFPVESWQDLIEKAKCARLDNIMELFENGKIPEDTTLLKKISSVYPDLASDVIMERKDLTFSQFRHLSGAFNEERWKRLHEKNATIPFPDDDDDNGIEWMLRKCIHMKDSGTYSTILQRYEVAPETYLSKKMYKASFAM